MTLLATELTAPPLVPPVCKVAVPMMASSIEGLKHQGWTSSVLLNILHKMAASIPWPHGVELCLPENNGTSLASYKDCLVVYLYNVDAGFRLPLPDHYCDFLSLSHLSAAQLYPNGWRYLANYTMRCYVGSITPQANHMARLFTMKYDGAMVNLSPSTLNLMNKPSNVGKWKKRWFLVRDYMHSILNFPIYPSPFVRPKKPAKRTIDSWKTAIRHEGAPLDFKKLITPENLEKIWCPPTKLSYPDFSRRHCVIPNSRCRRLLCASPLITGVDRRSPLLGVFFAGASSFSPSFSFAQQFTGVFFTGISSVIPAWWRLRDFLEDLWRQVQTLSSSGWKVDSAST